jgi:hypothetical protein
MAVKPPLAKSSFRSNKGGGKKCNRPEIHHERRAGEKIKIGTARVDGSIKAAVKAKYPIN